MRYSIILLTFLSTVACKTSNKTKSQAELASVPGSSTFLSDAGDNAKAFFYKQVEQRNDFAKANKLIVRFEVMDARDPRLYARGAAIQPPTPADKVLVKVAENGAFLIMAFILDRPGVFTVKESPTGNLLIDVSYGVERIDYRSRFDGLYGSVHRVTSGYGWEYVYYIRGFGNNITPVMFDQAARGFMSNAVLYVTPLFPDEVKPQVFGPTKP